MGLPPGGGRWVGQAEVRLRPPGTGSKVCTAQAARLCTRIKARRPSTGASSQGTPSRVHLSDTSLLFTGLCLRGCGAIFGKYRRRGFLWPCSGPSFLSLSATVYFTGPCTSTQLLISILWSRKSDGWKPRCCDWQCPGSEGFFQPPRHVHTDARVGGGGSGLPVSPPREQGAALSEATTRSSVPLPAASW